MTTLDLLHLGLLSAPFLAGLATAGSGSAAPEPDDKQERERHELRNANGVRLIGPEEESAPLEECPEGVFGWTNSPVTGAIPLFHNRIFRAFEVHRLPDGTARYIGYLTPEESAKVQEGKQTVEVKLFPEPYGESAVIQQIPLSRVGRRKGPSRENGNWIDLEVFADK
jgi:hypothetical protein